jgi:hypothetical protein
MNIKEVYLKIFTQCGCERKLIEHNLYMNNQMGNTGQGEPLVEFEVYIRGVLSLVVFGYIFDHH